MDFGVVLSLSVTIILYLGIFNFEFLHYRFYFPNLLKVSKLGTCKGSRVVIIMDVSAITKPLQNQNFVSLSEQGTGQIPDETELD